MRPFALVSSFFFFVAAAAADVDVDTNVHTRPASTQTATIYLEPVGPLSVSSQPALLAEIRYDAYDLSQAEVTSYAPPEDDGDDQDDQDDTLYRVGLYDPSVKRWLSATSVTSAANFAKGYRPHIVLTVTKAAASEEILPLAASVRGLVIDAGATRDFGPQVTVVTAGVGAAPALNRPVVLNPEGKVEVPEEKTFLQKYWWIIAIAVLVMTATSPPEQ